jgi:hypothetical protein
MGGSKLQDRFGSVRGIPKHLGAFHAMIDLFDQ